MNSLSFRVGGVPEHFNYPWQLAQQYNLTETQNFSFSWQDFPGGTGAMLQALENDLLDVAVLLTEGAVSAIAQGLDARIIGTYVESPLQWGVHVPAQSNMHTLADTQHKTYAISRPRSGSHLMTYVHHQNHNWPTNSIKFKEIGNFEGARQAFKAEEADVFLWEKYTTKPTVDSGEWRRVGVCPTPWPSFVLIAKRTLCETQMLELQKLMEIVRHAKTLYNAKDTLHYIAVRYGLAPEDVAEWFAQTRWSCRPEVSREMLINTQNTLQSLGILPTPCLPETLIGANCTWSESVPV